MVYIKSWTQFHKQVCQLYDEQPLLTRSSIKLRPVDGVLVLKVTDNTKCIKHKTTSAVILNRFETLNRVLLMKMAGAKAAPLDLSTPMPPPPSAEPTAVPSEESKAAGTTAATAGEKNKKKKKKR